MINMTPDDAKKMLADWETLVMVRSDFDQKLVEIARNCIEAARIVERERCAELLNEYDCVCGRLLGGGKHGNSYLQQKILSPNQDCHD